MQLLPDEAVVLFAQDLGPIVAARHWLRLDACSVHRRRRLRGRRAGRCSLLVLPEHKHVHIH